LIAGASAGVYFATTLTNHGPARPTVSTYTSAGILTVSGDVSSVAYNQNGSQLASSDGNSIVLWNTSTVLWNTFTNKVARPYKSTGTFSDLAIDAVAFSPDGSQLAVGDGNSVNLWNLTTNKVARTYKPAGISGGAGSGGVSSVAFSPDGTTLAATFGNGHTYLWDMATGKLATTLRGDSSVAFSPDGSQLAVGDGNSVNLWNIPTQATAATFSDPASGGVSAVAFSPAITWYVDAFGHPTERGSAASRALTQEAAVTGKTGGQEAR
jgi:WD40 repeat protein